MATIHPFPAPRRATAPSLQFFIDQIRRRLERNRTPVFSDDVVFDSRKPCREDYVPRVDIACNGKPEAIGVWLNDAISPIDDPDGYSEAYNDLLATGTHRCGGGAAPTFDLTLHNPPEAA